MQEQIKAYHTAETMGKSQVGLILMVYDGALKAVEQATTYYDEGQHDEGYEEIQKVKKFVTHLYTTLDREQGGAVAENLSRMYVYVLTQCYVIEANQSRELLDNIAQVLGNLRSAWAELQRQENPDASPAADEEPATAELEAFMTTA